MADEVDLGFNSDALRAIYVHEFRSNALELDGGWLHHTDNGNVLHVGLNLSDSRRAARKTSSPGSAAGSSGTTATSKQDGFSCRSAGSCSTRRRESTG